MALKTFSGQFINLEKDGRSFGRAATQSLAGIEREANRAARGTQSAFTNAFSAVKSQASGLKGVLSGALSFAGGGAVLGGISALTGGLANMAGAVFDVRDQLERAEVGFTTLFEGNKEKAKSFISELRQFSKATPFELSGTVSSAQTLLAQGFSQNQIIPILKGVGSATASAGKGSQEFQSILSQLSQTAAKGKAELEDLKIIAESGVPVFDILSKSIGVSQEQLFKFLSEGRLRGKETVELLAEEFGRKFPNALDDLSKTTSGTITNIKENLTGTAADVLDPAFTRLNTLLRETNKLLEGPGFATFAANARSLADTLTGSLETGIRSLFGGKPGEQRLGDAALQSAAEIGSGQAFAELPGRKGLDKLGRGESVGIKDFIDVGAEIEAVKGIVGKIGEAIPDGVKEGIRSKANAVIETTSGLGTDMLNGLKSILGIKSPSKRMYELGEYAGDGFANGLIDRTSVGFQKWRKTIEKEVGDVEAFLKRIEQIAAKVGANPNELLNVLAFESRFNPQAQNPRGTATGLIQFTAGTAKGLGTSVSELKAQNAIQQLDYVEKYLLQFGKLLDTQEALYTSVLAGRVVRDPETVLFKSGTKAFTANRELDRDKSGGITAAEAAFQTRKQGFTTPGQQQQPPTVRESVTIVGRQTVSAPEVSLPTQLALKEIRTIQAEAPQALAAIKTAATGTNAAITTTTAAAANTQSANFRRIVRDAEQTAKQVKTQFDELKDGIRDSFKSAFDQLLQGDLKGAGKSLLQSLAGVGRNALTSLVFGNGQRGAGGGSGGGGGLGSAITQAVTGGFAGGNPAQQILGGSGNGGGSGLSQVLGKLPSIGNFFKSGVASPVGKIGDLPFANTSNLQNLSPLRAPGVGELSAAGKLIQPGGLLGKIPLLGKAGGFLSKIPGLGSLFGGGGAAGAAGAAGGTAGGGAAGGAALFSNPVTAIIGAALVAAPFVLKLFADRTFNKFRSEVKSAYQIEVDKKQEGRALFQSAEEIGKRAFGKQYKSKIPELVKLRQVKEQIGQYGAATGQDKSSLVRQFAEKEKVGDPDDPRNQIVRREFGGPVRRGDTVLVGERRPEILVPGSDGFVFPSIGAYERQLISALQKRAAGGFFGGAFGKLAGQVESAAFARSAGGGSAAGNGGGSNDLMLGVLAELTEAVAGLRGIPASHVVSQGLRENPNLASRALATDLRAASPEAKQIIQRAKGYK